MSSGRFIFFIIILGVFLIGASLSYFLFKKESEIVNKQNLKEEASINWKYDLEEIDRPYSDKRLVKINPLTGDKEVIIESLNNKISKDLLLELFSIGQVSEEKNAILYKAKLLFGESGIEKFWEDFSLEQFSFPQKSQKLFLQLAYPTDVPFPNLISYNLSNQEFQAMKVNSYYRDGFNERFLSPNGNLLLVPSGYDLSQKLWLLDLKNDTAKLLVQLSGNETFDREIEGAFRIHWLGDETVEYAVYDQSTTKINKTLIEIRKAVIE